MINLTRKSYNLSKTQIDFVTNKVKSMSLEEKIGQLFFVIGIDTDDDGLKAFINHYKPGE